MLKDFINSELDDCLNVEVKSPLYSTCCFEENVRSLDFPLARSLAIREEMSLDTTKCMIIKLPSKQRIYEWFKGDEYAYFVYEFVKIQMPEYKNKPFELKIEKASPTEQNDVLLNPNQSIRSQCPGPRLFLNLYEIPSNYKR